MLVKVTFILLILAVVGFSATTTPASVSFVLGQVQEQIQSESDDKLDPKWVIGELLKMLKTTLIFSNGEVSEEQSNTYPETISKCQECAEKKLLRDDFVKLGNIYYHFSRDVKNWHDALTACQKKGAGLAYPLNAIENENLKAYLRTHFSKTAFWWLDGTDYAQEGKWVWQHDNSPITYFDWYKTEPDNGGLTGSQCLVYWEIDNWRFGDGYCPSLVRYICQAQVKCNHCP